MQIHFCVFILGIGEKLHLVLSNPHSFPERVKLLGLFSTNTILILLTSSNLIFYIFHTYNKISDKKGKFTRPLVYHNKIGFLKWCLDVCFKSVY